MSSSKEQKFLSVVANNKMECKSVNITYCAIVILKYNYFFLLGDVCTCVGIRNRHRQFPWKHDNKTVGIIMSITKTLFEVIAINIISPAKNINEERKKIRE